MKVMAISLLATLTTTFTLLAGSHARAQEPENQESEFSGAVHIAFIYRCQAVGRNERVWVEGEATNSNLKNAELGALRACRAKGGTNCTITHCMRE